MANAMQLSILKQGPNQALAKSRSQRSVAAWNAWRDKQAPNTGIDLSGADFRRAYLRRADFSDADLSGADLSRANLGRADFSGANLRGAYLRRAYLSRANFRGANLSGAYLSRANLSEADLNGANLRGANLIGATLVDANLGDADLTGCRIYGVSAWGLTRSEGTKQQGLIITRKREPEITTDDIEVAQFLYLLLHNEKIQRVIDTIGKKGVLLLGRFTNGTYDGMFSHTSFHRSPLIVMIHNPWRPMPVTV
jgi:hypothetical protein